MAKKITIRSGNTSINMSDDLFRMTDSLLNKLLPETKKILQKELQNVKDEAKKRWLVRQSKSVSPEKQQQKVYYALLNKANKTPNEALRIINDNKRKGLYSGKAQRESKKSKRSVDKLYVELAITPNLELLGIVGNTAEYAWAIKVGEDPQKSGLKEGQRLSNELLFKPTKKKSNIIASTFADEILKIMK